MLTRLPAHRDELERDDVGLSGTDRREIIGEATILSAALFERLARKCETRPFSSCVVFVNDQIVPARLTWKISVNQFRFKQFFADRLSFYIGKFRVDSLGKNLLIFLGCLPSLFVLPLPFEKRRLVDESENLVEVRDLDNLRTVKGSGWNFNVAGNSGKCCVRRITR